MLHVLQRIESIHEMQAGYSLEYQNIQYTYIYIYIYIHKGFYKQITNTHLSMMVCILTLTLKDAICKIKIWNTLMPQKWSIQAVNHE